jgi:hypothetical protein
MRINCEHTELYLLEIDFISNTMENDLERSSQSFMDACIFVPHQGRLE